mmetsp:Transcript_986/g.909  ORF Transcript_986/g.909 Transcript_986/m.909 type:complete len:326 (-) Transcript_986:342-1319(-)
MQMHNWVWDWVMISSKYVVQSVKNVEIYLKENVSKRWKLPSRADNPFAVNYETGMDTSPELDPQMASYYQSQIGILRWMVELGRIDINTEVSMMALHLDLPREGHLDTLLHVYSYLKHKYNARLAMDPSYPDIDMSVFKECEWKRFYGNMKEAIPPDAPESRDKVVGIRIYVDSDHAGCKLTRRSRTRFMIFVITALIQWISKKQPTVETTVFGAEFVAMKHGNLTLRGLRYKLHMMGVQILGTTFFYGDNMPVVHNTQRPESMLKEKSHQLCYHACREATAMSEALVGHIRSELNFADLLTKLLFGRKRKYLVGQALYDIYDDF